MKHGRALSFALLLTLALPAAALAQQPKAEAKHAPTADEALVIAQTKATLQSFVDRDLAKFVQASGGNYVELTPSGPEKWDIDRASQYMKDCTVKSFTGSEFVPATPGPEVIVLTFKANVDQVCNAKPASGSWHALAVFQRRLAKWRVVSYSATPFQPAAAAKAAPVPGAPELPVLTDKQAWGRATMNLTATAVAVIANAREHGESPQAAGKKIGELFAPGWTLPAGADPVHFYAKGMAANLQSWPGTEPVITEAQGGTLTLRFTRTYRSFFGQGEKEMGVTVAEYDAFFQGLLDAVASHLGLQATLKTDGDYGFINIKKLPA